METVITKQCKCALLVSAMMLGGASSSRAQEVSLVASPCGTAPSSKSLIGGTLTDFKHLGSRGSLGILALGGVAAAGAHSVDHQVTQSFATTGSLRDAFTPGATIGGTPLELGAAFATFELGRALHKPCAASVGADLVRAQLMAEVLTIGLKQASRRSRPDGSGYSFPSGHTTMAFASATVLQRHFGWKVGVPAYAAATYVAASRVQMKRHYLSDVAFGAALGIVAGRTVPIGRRHELQVTPTATLHGGGVSFTWASK